MVTPRIRIAVILNSKAGGRGHTGIAGRLIESFAIRGLVAEITHVGDGGSALDIIRKAAESGVAAVVAGGGDGTVNLVASALSGGQVSLGVLPLGTLNHFARDMGLPFELDDAVTVIANGHVRAVDIGEVNGRIFLNNSSIGVYPRIVKLRDRYRHQGVGKWIAAAWATLGVLRRRPFLGVRIETPEGVLVRRTPFVLVGNNEYRMSGLHAASRDSLTEGKLAVYVMKAQGRRGLLRVAWEVLRRGAEETAELDLLSVEKATVETKRHGLQVALDGEVVMLQSPLLYRIVPGALRVLVP